MLLNMHFVLIILVHVSCAHVVYNVLDVVGLNGTLEALRKAKEFVTEYPSVSEHDSDEMSSLRWEPAPIRKNTPACQHREGRAQKSPRRRRKQEFRD